MAEVDYSEKRLSYFWSKHNRDYDSPEIVNDFVQWFNQPLYIVVKNRQTKEFKAIRARKRGDEKYAWRTVLRFENVRKNVRRKSVRTGRKHTSALWISLTYRDQSRQRWETIGHDFNVFISRIRRRYGKCSCIRVWESHKSGVPHVHLVLLFAEYSMECFTFRSKIRIKNKSEIAGLWPHGFTDIQGVYDLDGALEYILKYLEKTLNHELPGSTLTLAMCWFHRKRMFSISNDLIHHTHNSNTKTHEVVGVCVSYDLLDELLITWAMKTEKGVFIRWEKHEKTIQTALIAAAQ